MKRIRFIVLNTLFILVSFSLEAQTHLCGTIQDAQFMQRLDENVKRLESLTTAQRNTTKYIPVSFIMVADDNGNGRVAEERILDQVANLNAFYGPLDIIFYIDELIYLDKTSVYNAPSSLPAEIQMEIARDQNAMNVFICNTADSGSGQPGQTLGYYRPSRDWLVMRKDQINLTSSTLAHEVGHFFSLAHPHIGWECVAYNEDDYGNPVNRSSTLSMEGCNQPTRLIELVNGSNCTTAGDRVCDTPADYNFQFSPDYNISSCAGTVDVMDMNGDTVKPMLTNLMGYYLNCENYELTNGQNNLINSDYFSFDRNYIRTGFVPVLEEVTGPVNYIYPENGGETSAVDNVTLDWDDVPGANKYLVIIDRFITFSLQPERYIVDESELNLTTLEEDRIYYWKVWPYNESSTGAGWGPTQSFRATTSTAIEKIDGLEEVEIFPNPVSGNSTLFLKVTTSDLLDVEMRLVDMHGREVQNFGRFIFQNSITQREALSLENMSAGLYVLHVRSAEGGSYTKKIQVLP